MTGLDDHNVYHSIKNTKGSRRHHPYSRDASHPPPLTRHQSGLSTQPPSGTPAPGPPSAPFPVPCLPSAGQKAAAKSNNTSLKNASMSELHTPSGTSAAAQLSLESIVAKVTAAAAAAPRLAAAKATKAVVEGSGEVGQPSAAAQPGMVVPAAAGFTGQPSAAAKAGKATYQEMQSAKWQPVVKPGRADEAAKRAATVANLDRLARVAQQAADEDLADEKRTESSGDSAHRAGKKASAAAGPSATGPPAAAPAAAARAAVGVAGRGGERAGPVAPTLLYLLQRLHNQCKVGEV